MKSNSTPIISVVIPFSQEGELTAELCEEQLRGIPHEILMVSSWVAGLKTAKGEFICFLEKDCILGDDYFRSLLSVFEERPSFRKLAMVSPALGVNDWKKMVYGYRISPTSILPSHLKSSSETYHVQVGYLPGSLIRRTALNDMAPRGNDYLMESVNTCLYFWSNGQRVALNPDVTYVSTDDELDLPYHAEQDPSITEVIEMFKREMIG